MYSITAVFTKEPAVIAGALRAILMVLVLAGLVSFGEELLAGIVLAAEVVLTLFVRSTSTSTSSPTLEPGTTGKIAGSEETFTVPEAP